MPASERQASSSGAAHRWLLIGNSRWHWAEAASTGLTLWHETPAAGATTARACSPLAWAAVGAVPADARLDEAGRLGLGDVPLREVPPWLGIDRALGGWRAWQEQPDRPVLVADAGTVLSLTRVDRTGGFRGGRLLAGAALQLRAMAAGTTALPDRSAGLTGLGGAEGGPRDPWPSATAAALEEGVVRGLAAAITAAAHEALAAEGECRLVLTGGDAPLLFPLVEPALGTTMAVSWRPALCLEALARLRPPVADAANTGASGAGANSSGGMSSPQVRPSLRPVRDR